MFVAPWPPEPNNGLVWCVKKRVSGKRVARHECLHGFGVIYRDLKPENVMLDEAGNPIVIDLGIMVFNPE